MTSQTLAILVDILETSWSLINETLDRNLTSNYIVCKKVPDALFLKSITLRASAQGEDLVHLVWFKSTSSPSCYSDSVLFYRWPKFTVISSPYGFQTLLPLSCKGFRQWRKVWLPVLRMLLEGPQAESFTFWPMEMVIITLRNSFNVFYPQFWLLI